MRASHNPLAAVDKHLKFARVHAIVRLNEWVAKVVDAELLQRLQLPVVEVQVVGIPVECQDGLWKLMG